MTKIAKPRAQKPPAPRPAHRPPADGVAADAWVKVRVTPARKLRWAKAAELAGISLSKWLTALADRAS